MFGIKNTAQKKKIEELIKNNEQLESENLILDETVKRLTKQKEKLAKLSKEERYTAVIYFRCGEIAEIPMIWYKEFPTQTRFISLNKFNEEVTTAIVTNSEIKYWEKVLNEKKEETANTDGRI